MVYIWSIIDFIEVGDVILGLIKVVVFGFIIVFMGCFNGYYSVGGV